MTDAELVLLKLSRLREHVALARRRRPADAGVLASDLDLRDALALSVLVAAGEAVEVAMHVVTDQGWGLPDSQRAALDALARAGVIDGDLAVTLGGVVHVRNRIAHGYASVDHARLWAELPQGLDALERFASAIARWMASQPGAP